MHASRCGRLDLLSQHYRGRVNLCHIPVAHMAHGRCVQGPGAIASSESGYSMPRSGTAPHPSHTNCRGDDYVQIMFVSYFKPLAQSSAVQRDPVRSCASYGYCEEIYSHPELNSSPLLHHDESPCPASTLWGARCHAQSDHTTLSRPCQHILS